MGVQLITGYPSSWRAPFSAAEIHLGQGPSNAPSAARAALYTAPKTSAGNWTVNVPVEVRSEQDAITGAGPGSPLHRMIRKHLRINPKGKLYALPYAASSGGGGVATATGTLTFTTTPTAKGLVTAYVCGELVTYSYTTSDTVTTIATGLRDVINQRTHLPVTASNASGVLTITAKIAGASQGDGTVGVLRFRASVTAGTGLAVAASGAALGLGTGTAGADGTTSELSNLTAALAAIPSTHYYYKGFSVWSSADTAVIETHVALQRDPNPGLLCRSFFGYTSTISNASTIAIARNHEGVHMCWQKNSEHDTAELAAWLLAIHQREEQTLATYPGFDGYTNQEILPAYAETDWPTDTDVNDAVTDGICCIRSTTTQANLAMSVTTRSKDTGGTIDDFRATETHRVSGMDYYVDTVLTRWHLNFRSKGFFLKDDPLTSDGNVDLNARGKLPPRTITPSIVKDWLKRINVEMAAIPIFRDAAEWNDSLRVNVDPNNSSRVEVGASGRTIDIAHQATFKFSETSPG